MRDLTPKERYLNILKGKEVDRPSCTCPLQTGTVELMEKTGAFWPQAHSDPEKMLELAYAAHKYAGLESVRLPFCLTVEAEAIGCKLKTGDESSQPSVVGHVLSGKSIDDISVPEPEKDGRMPAVGQAVSMAQEKYGEDLPILAGIVGPFTLAGHMKGVENLLLDFFDDIDSVMRILAFTQDICASYGRYLEDMGADSVVIIEPTATTELIGPDSFRDMVKPILMSISSALSNPSVLHICGDTTPMLKDMGETGIEAISVDHLVDLGEAREILKSNALVGNINPIDTLMMGTRDAIACETTDCIKKGADIIAPGCGISPKTPTENISTYTSIVKEA